MKRVLITTYPGAYIHHGGGEREIHLLKDALNGAGIISDLYGPTSLPIDEYDELIHFSTINGSDLIVDAASGGGRRRILWPNLWFVTPPSPEHLDYLRHLVSRFDAVVFKSSAEERIFREYFDISQMDVIHIVPLVSRKFFRHGVSPVFKESYGLEDYAIWPGIIEPQKNQLTAIRAFNELDTPLVISGQVRCRDYFEQCRAEAGKNVHFIPSMPFGSELHVSALAHCRLFIELPLDFPGTSALEAAVLGCRLLLSRTDWVSEFLQDRCVQVSPLDVAEVRKEVLEFFSKPDKFSTAMDIAHYTDFIPDTAATPLIEYLKRC